MRGRTTRDDLKEHLWPKYFWRHNYDLAVCKHREVAIAPAKNTITPQEGEKLQDIMAHNASCARQYLDKLRYSLKQDLYDPTRDEILFGLFGRLTRFYCLMCEDVFLWARDIGGIMLRCFADTAITFSYLSSKGSSEEFKRFVEYGEGQQKLLMLHLQDNYPEELSLEGLSSEELSNQGGKFAAELVDIELGHWNKKDTRRMAQDVGMEKFYRLIFSPASSELHGSWLSLKHSNLTHCSESLHRFHRIPSYVEPPFFMNMAEAARDIYEHIVTVAIEILSYPKPDMTLKKLSDIRHSQTADTTDA